MIIMDISIFMDILYMKKIILLSFLMMLSVSTATAHGAQFLWDARTEETQLNPKITFQRTISLEYMPDSIVAKELQGSQVTEYFLSDSSTNGISELVEKINKHLEEHGSHVRVSDAVVEYTVTLTGRPTSATVDYKLVLIPTISDFLIREYDIGSPALLDVSWRSIRVSGPVMVGGIEINLPASFLQKHFPNTYNELAGTGAETILLSNLLDASGVGLPLAKWHSLFDPTPIISDAQRFGFNGDIVTTYSMGESRIGVSAKEKISETSSADYKLTSIEAADSATILVPGYATPDILLGIEVIGTSPNALDGSQFNDQGQFPVFIIYGMTGIAASGAVVFFWWSNKKAKHDEFLGQSGIDPAYLRSVQTSTASGGYHTNRGEAHLITSDSKTDAYKVRGTMPRDWK